VCYGWFFGDARTAGGVMVSQFFLVCFFFYCVLTVLAAIGLFLVCTLRLPSVYIQLSARCVCKWQMVSELLGCAAMWYRAKKPPLRAEAK